MRVIKVMDDMQVITMEELTKITQQNLRATNRGKRRGPRKNIIDP